MVRSDSDEAAVSSEASFDDESNEVEVSSEAAGASSPAVDVSSPEVAESAADSCEAASSDQAPPSSEAPVSEAEVVTETEPSASNAGEASTAEASGTKARGSASRSSDSPPDHHNRHHHNQSSTNHHHHLWPFWRKNSDYLGAARHAYRNPERWPSSSSSASFALALSRGHGGRAGEDPRPWSGTRRRSAPTTPARSAAPTTSADHRHRVLGAIALFLEEGRRLGDPRATRSPRFLIRSQRRPTTPGADGRDSFAWRYRHHLAWRCCSSRARSSAPTGTS